MESVKRVDDIFRFKCAGCKRTFQAQGKEFDYVKLGTLSYWCPKCNKQQKIWEVRIDRVPGYKPAE